MDGQIIIGTGLDVKGLEKDLAKLQKDLEKYVKDEEKLTEKKLNLEIDTQRALDDLQTLDDRVEILKEKLQSIETRKSQIVSWQQNESNKEWVKLSQDYDTTKAKISELTRKEEEIVSARERQLGQINEINKELVENSINQDVTNKKIDETNEKLKKAKNNIDLGPLFKKMSSSLDNVGKKVGRIGLSMLGIRSLYGMISSSVSRITQSNAEIKGGIDAINNVLDNIIGQLLQALLPVINIIVKGINFIAQELFGIDVTSNQFSNNMKSANKSATKLRKQLLGFDEMNILNEDGSIGALGGTTSGKSKDYGIYNDMSDLNKDLADLGVVAVYTGDDLKETRLQLEQLIADVKLGNATMSEKNGIVTIMNKAGNSIQFTKQEYEKLLDDINHSRVTSRNLDIWWRVKDAFQGWNIKSFKKYMGKAVDIANNGSKSMQKEINQVKDNFVKNLDGATYSFENGIYKIKMTNGEIVELTKEQWAELQPYMKYVGLNIESNANNTGGKIQAKSNETKNKVVADAKETRDEVVGYINEISGASDQSGTNIQEGAQGVARGVITSSQQGVENIENEYGKLPKWMQDNVFVQLLKDFGVLGDGTGQTFGKGLKDAVNKVLDKIEKTINNVFVTANNMFKKFGINMTTPKITLPRLAKGGIINRVGKGVPLALGGAIAGERGREAVVPLTDTQQMQYLGREIAKHIVVNLTNVTELDGRQIARSITKVMQDTQFASNGGVI